MADIVLSDGREFEIDLNKITIIEYRGIFDKEESNDKSDETVAKTIGLTLEELQALGFVDYRTVMSAFFQKVRDVMNSPNSARPSGSP